VCGRGAATSRANRSIDRSIELDRDRRVVDRGFDSIDDASIAMGSIRAIDARARCLAIARAIAIAIDRRRRDGRVGANDARLAREASRGRSRRSTRRATRRATRGDTVNR
jgi:hypothetical protein